MTDRRSGFSDSLKKSQGKNVFVTLDKFLGCLFAMDESDFMLILLHFSKSGNCLERQITVP